MPKRVEGLAFRGSLVRRLTSPGFDQLSILRFPWQAVAYLMHRPVERGAHHQETDETSPLWTRRFPVDLQPC